MVDGMLDLAALVLAGIIGAIVLEPAKVAVRVTANRLREPRRRR
jgi:hypothetical protein